MRDATCGGELEVLLRELARFAVRLADVGTRWPGEPAARCFLHLLPERNNAPTDVWGWTRLLLQWQQWRPPHFLRRLLTPDPEELETWRQTCQRWSGRNSSAGGWRGKIGLSRLFGGREEEEKAQEVFSRLADCLETWQPPSRERRRALEELLHYGLEVEKILSRLRQRDHWVPLTLVELVEAVAETAERWGCGMPLPPGPWLSLLEEAGSPPAVATDNNKKMWRGWLSDGGTPWFDQLANLAQRDPAAAEWLQAVCQGLAVECYPRWDGSKVWHWPAQAESPPGKVECRIGGTSGRIIQVDRYGTDPSQVICTWEAPRELTDYYEHTLTLFRQAQEEGLHTLADSCKRELSRVLADGQLPSHDQVIQIVDSAPAGDATPSPAGDLLPPCLRRWLSALGWKIFPGSEDDAAECWDHPERYQLRPIFKKDVPARTILSVRVYGLEDSHGRIIRPALVQVSAGPPPVGLNELEAVVRQAPGEISQRLQEVLRDLRLAGMHGYLEQQAVDLFKLYWEIQPQWSQADPQSAQQFGDHLLGMLRENFGLSTFEPKTDRDYPAEWVTYAPGTRLTTGRVTRILRPGLYHPVEGILRLPAYVEAE